MSKIHTCPVCNGQGTINRPPHIAGDQKTWTSASIKFYPCSACKGSGIIWEQDNSGTG